MKWFLIFLALVIFSGAGFYFYGEGLFTKSFNDENVEIYPLDDKELDKLEHKIVRFGRIPFTSPREMIRNHKVLMDYLRDRLGVKKVKLELAKDYESLQKLFESGKIQVAWLGSSNYITMRDKVDIEALVKPVRHGSSFYGGIIITHKDSGIKKIEDLKGRSFAYIDTQSASGYLYPKAMLLEQGFDPEKECSKVEFLKKHDTVVYAVFYKKFDAGAVYDDARVKLKEPGQKEQVIVLARTDPIPNEPIVVSKKLDDKIKKALKKAFLDLDDKSEVLKQFRESQKDSITGFDEVDDKSYAPVEKAMKLLNLE